MADLLLGRVLRQFALVLSCLGRFFGLVMLPAAASLASLSACSLPGIPLCPGVHLIIISLRWWHFRAIRRFSWNISMRWCLGLDMKTCVASIAALLSMASEIFCARGAFFSSSTASIIPTISPSYTVWSVSALSSKRRDDTCMPLQCSTAAPPILLLCPDLSEYRTVSSVPSVRASCSMASSISLMSIFVCGVHLVL